VWLLTVAFVLPNAARAETLATPPVTPAVHTERIAKLEALLDACIAQSAQCNSDAVGADETVLLDGKTATRIRLDWLRVGLGRLKTETGPAHNALAADLSTRLKRLSHASDAVEQARIQQASTQVSQVLAAAEFAPERKPNWLERKWHEFLLWIYDLLSRGVESVSNTPAWVRILLEVLLFLVPVLLLLVWLMRKVREDCLRPSSEGGPRPQIGFSPKTDWPAMAEELARQGLWREAIHALYWATIARLESRKLWTASRTRTPREYIGLLESGSRARTALMEQTRLFELIWYGQRLATEDDFRRATQFYAATEAQ
jgi:hypothetical protein